VYSAKSATAIEQSASDANAVFLATIALDIISTRPQNKQLDVLLTENTSNELVVTLSGTI
jgi:hypothetical protein